MVGGGVTRSSSIDLNSINEKVRTVEGTARVTPISMKNLNDRIDNLIATAQKWKIFNFEFGNSEHTQTKFTIDDVYKNLYVLNKSNLQLSVSGYTVTVKKTNYNDSTIKGQVIAVK